MEILFAKNAEYGRIKKNSVVDDIIGERQGCLCEKE